MLDERRVILGGIVLALVPAFGVTHLFVREYKDRRQELAREWRERGERDFVGRPVAAVADYETALSYQDSPEDHFRLAEALIAARRPAEARAHLLTLWAQEPGDGPINVELARLAAADGDVPNAIRYYHFAVDGAWDRNAAAERRAARLELVELLLSKAQNDAAEAQLITMLEGLPPDPDMLIGVGRLFMRTGAQQRAMDAFERALRLDPRNGQAARLAGGLAFRSGNYALAHRYLVDAERRVTLSPDEVTMRDVSARVLALDPFLRGTTARERAERVLDCLKIARARIDRCAPSGALAAGITDVGTPGLASLARDSDLRERVMAIVFDAAESALPGCDAASVDEQALQRIAVQRRAPSR